MEWNMRPHSLLPLPQFDRLFLTDAGLETDIIFNRGIDLPLFASISPLRTVRGRQALKDYFRPNLELTVQHGSCFVLESASWPHSPAVAAPLGLPRPDPPPLIVA